MAQVADQGEFDRRYLHSIVLIESTAGARFSWGAGLVIGVVADPAGGNAALTVLTAKHVVTSPSTARVSLYYKPYLFHPVDSVEVLDDGLDAALLTVLLPIKELEQADIQLMPLALSPAPGARLYPIGHPWNNYWFHRFQVPLVETGTNAEIQELTVASSQFGDQSCNGEFFDIARPCIVKGFSGGPVLDTTGAWAGIIYDVIAGVAHAYSAVDLYERIAARADVSLNLVRSFDEQLLLAAHAGEAGRIRKLCENGARLISRGENGSALHIAARNNDVAVAGALQWCAGLDLEAPNSFGWTPLMMAAWRANEDMVDLLLSWGADARAKTPSGMTALHLVAERPGNVARRPNIIRALVVSGADSNASDEGSWTPLLSATAAERDGPPRTQIVKALLKAGADPNLYATLEVTGSIEIPLHLAAEHGLSATVAALLAGGARVDTVDKNGLTALMLVAKRPKATSPFEAREGDFSCRTDDDDLTLKARVLIQHDADTSLRDFKEGKTALDFAKSRYIGTPGDRRCQDCMIAALTGESCRDTWED